MFIRKLLAWTTAKPSAGHGHTQGQGQGQAQRHGHGHGGQGHWHLEHAALRDYVSFVKTTFHPSMGAEAKYLVMRYYQMQRQSDERNGRATVREKLVSLLETFSSALDASIAFCPCEIHA